MGKGVPNPMDPAGLMGGAADPAGIAGGKTEDQAQQQANVTVTGEPVKQEDMHLADSSYVSATSGMPLRKTFREQRNAFGTPIG